MMINTGAVSNRLINEKSAYLLQHAHNPVDWFPWCDEAFEKAKTEDKPVFLSIGYSTCHWCHVMEKESFEDADVAEILNEYFISIKVDREERPDIDNIYMTVCQMLTGSGGWPMSIIMDSDKKPFFAGTYFPKNNRGGMTGFISLLKSISELWQNDRKRITAATAQILDAIKNINNDKNGELTVTAIDKAIKYFKQSFDEQYGGFGSAPKFPSPHNLLFLLRYHHKTQDKKILEIVEKTLDSMYRGGIYDHIGFGFSRYSTDEKWLVPHFEKMLYDNALLSMVYAEAYQATKNELFAKTAKEIFEYIRRDMTSPEGTFYSAEDADSEGIEGKFYVWTPAEIVKILGNEDGKHFCELYDITARGNFEGENIPNLIGKNLTDPDMDFAEGCMHKLFEERKKRIHPFKDTKILTSWNGLMIASLSLAGRIFGDKDYTEQAVRCAQSVTDSITADSRLFAEDYAFLIWGLIELYETTFNEEYLGKAIELTNVLLDDFWDNDSAGVFLYGAESERLLLRPKEIYDGATPSTNSVMAYNLLRLSRLTGMHEFEDKVQAILNHFAEQIEQMPAAYSFSLVSLLYLNSASKEIVIVAKNTEQSNRMIEVLRENYLPFMTCLLKTPDNKNLENYAEFIKGYEMIDRQCTAYACKKVALFFLYIGYPRQKSPAEHKSNRANRNYSMYASNILFHLVGQKIPAHKDDGFF